jgi:hypothetical protein
LGKVVPAVGGRSDQVFSDESVPNRRSHANLGCERRLCCGRHGASLTGTAWQDGTEAYRPLLDLYVLTGGCRARRGGASTCTSSPQLATSIRVRSRARTSAPGWTATQSTCRLLRRFRSASEEGTNREACRQGFRPVCVARRPCALRSSCISHRRRASWGVGQLEIFGPYSGGKS